MIDLNDIPVFDHHAHSLAKVEKINEINEFTKWFTEASYSDYLQDTLFFNYSVNNISEFLNCESNIESIIETRNKYDFSKLINKYFEDAKIDYFLCDHGFQTIPNKLNSKDLKTYINCKIKDILRIETLAESLICKHKNFTDYINEYETTLEQLILTNECVAFKSIAAYRSGLNIASVNFKNAEDEFNKVKAKKGNDRFRLECKPIIDFLLNIALKTANKYSFPFQFHTGFGDKDIFLPDANPSLLSNLFSKYKNVKFVLLHSGWPYYKETAFLSSVYNNVWLDLSLMIPFTTCGINTTLKEIFGIAPLSKILFATDAFTFPEIFWIAVKLGKKNIAELFDDLHKQHYLNQKQIEKYAYDIFFNNSKSLYLR